MTDNKKIRIVIDLQKNLFKELAKTTLYNRCGTNAEYLRTLIREHVDSEKSNKKEFNFEGKGA